MTVQIFITVPELLLSTSMKFEVHCHMSRGLLSLSSWWQGSATEKPAKPHKRVPRNFKKAARQKPEDPALSRLTSTEYLERLGGNRQSPPFI
jgi:hypothetical protein